MLVRYTLCFIVSVVLHIFIDHLHLSNVINWIDVDSGSFPSYRHDMTLFTLSTFVCGYILTYFTSTHTRDGDLWPAFQKMSFWRYFLSDVVNLKEYSVNCDTPLDSEQQCIFACFPHGANSVQHMLTMTDVCGMISKQYPYKAKKDGGAGEGRRDLAASILFYIPIVREILLWLGNVDASKSTCEYLLKKGRSLLIFVGGEKEQLLTREGQNRIYITKRKGFVRLAVKHQLPIVPIYAFGENDLYHVSEFAMGFRLWLEKWGIAFCITSNDYPWTQMIFNWWKPIKGKSLHVEIGNSVPPPAIDNATASPEEILKAVDEMHEKVIKGIQMLFDKKKKMYGLKESDKLEII